MATKTNITELRTRVTEADQAKAYRDIESDIYELRCMMHVLNKVVASTIDHRDNIQKTDPEHTIITVPDEDLNTLHYALSRVEEMARELDDKYQKGATLPVTGACNG